MIRCLIVLSCLFLVHVPAEEFEWQKQHAKAEAHGDLIWSPRPYVFNPGKSVRYIDFEAGDDAASGLSKDQAWKHHPWDGRATAKAKTCTGIHTYVFKGGVVYRGQLIAKESGTAKEPIQLCRDPNWGTGPAVISGSELAAGFKKGVAPKAIPAHKHVWSARLSYAPRNVWMVHEGKITRLPLARMPNWRSRGRDDIKAEWWTWKNTGKGIRHFGNKKKVHKTTLNFANDPNELTAKRLKHIKGSYVWSEYGWVMGTPFPSKVRAVYPSQNGVAFGSQWSDSANSHIISGCRYYFDDKAQFLDDVEQGEFWFQRDDNGEGGVLHVLLPNNLKPSDVQIEAAHYKSLINADQTNHLHISGLTFQFTNTEWNLDSTTSVKEAAILINGSSNGVKVTNCQFYDVNMALRASASGPEDYIHQIEFSDNDVNRTDHGGLAVLSGGGVWAQVMGPFGVVHEVRAMRNRFQYIGRRPTRFGQGHCLHIECARMMHIAGNIFDMCWGAGVFVYGGKNRFSDQDVPLRRILIHHNKVTNAVLNTNDWGGIETWQGGPAYVFNNISGDIRGYWNYNYQSSRGKDVRNASFGHAYYMDGAYKNYHFNNIAFGRTRDWQSPYQTCSAFQEIHSYQNTVFNNTAYNFQIGSRRQAPQPGRDKFLGNIFDGVHTLFRHSDANPAKQGNAADVKAHGHEYSYDTLAYGRNLIYDVTRMGNFDGVGTQFQSLQEFAQNVAKRGTLAQDVAELAPDPLVPEGNNGNFKPSTFADGKGVKVFVPWALYRCVAEWHFYPSQTDGRIIDEHWDMPPYRHLRAHYHDYPMFPLRPQGSLKKEHAVKGILENWCKGAVKLDGQTQYWQLEHDVMMTPISYSFNVKKESHPKRGQKITIPVEGKGIKNPQVYDSNMLIEVYLKIHKDKDGLIVKKMDDKAGYSLSVENDKVVFHIKSGKHSQKITSDAQLASDQWHHIIVEADREAKEMRIYLDGSLHKTSPGLGAVNLENAADLFVGGKEGGEHLEATFEFMRICHGTLADAQTSIEELYAWQFSGPQYRDFSGQRPKGAGRDAGAIEGH